MLSMFGDYAIIRKKNNIIKADNILILITRMTSKSKYDKPANS